MSMILGVGFFETFRNKVPIKVIGSGCPLACYLLKQLFNLVTSDSSRAVNIHHCEAFIAEYRKIKQPK